MVPCLPSLDWDPYSMLCTVHYFGKPHLDWKYGIILYGLYHQSGQLTWHTFPSLLLHQPSNPKAQHIAWTPRYLLGLVSLFLSSEKPQIFFLVKKKSHWLKCHCPHRRHLVGLVRRVYVTMNPSLLL